VAHLALDTRGANDVRELGERSSTTDDFHAGGLRTGSFGRGRQRRDSVQQAVLTVHQEAEMGEEVGPDEELCDVGQHEAPRERNVTIRLFLLLKLLHVSVVRPSSSKKYVS
jgi:predicted nucleic acid-binding Zn ribbon protein